MLVSIKRFFELHIVSASGEHADPQQALRIAVAVLLVEIAEADYQNDPKERDELEGIVRDQFELTEAEAAELIALARSEHSNSTDYFQFTSLINEHFSGEQKIEMIENLWRIAFADNQLHHNEEHVIRRLADLLHVPHSQFIKTKHRIVAAKKRGD